MVDLGYDVIPVCIAGYFINFSFKVRVSVEVRVRVSNSLGSG